jgi:hypothetical protein
VIFKLVSKAYACRLSPVAHRALLKLDFEKAYDRVNWQFLIEVLLAKGFDPAYVHRIMQLVTGGHTTISINGEVGPYFRNKRGVRQEDPISPLLFNFVADALDAILVRARVAGHIQGWFLI